MLSKTIQDALNDQLNFEQHSAQLYLGMAADAAALGLNGIAGWLRAQEKEEVVHAEKLFDFINVRGGQIKLGDVKGPAKSFTSVKDVFETALAHEKTVSARIHKLLELARAEKDHATELFLNWFVTEQVEEEASFRGILEKLELAGNKGGSLLVLDHALGQRK